MAKTIKFNLICDGYPVRTLDELREHFSIEDVLTYHRSGMLQRWLEVRGFTKALDAVREVPVTDQMKAAKELIKIFDIETDESRIEEAVYILRYEDERKESEKRFLEIHQQKEDFLSEYFSSYQGLKESMAEHKDDFAALKADVNTLHTEYLSAFELDYRNLFYYLKSKAPMAVYMMLAYEEMRRKYIPDSAVQQRDEAGVIDDAVLSREVDLLLQKTDTSVLNRTNIIEAVKNKKSKEELARSLVNYHNNPASFGVGITSAMYGKKSLDFQCALKEVEEFFKRLCPKKGDYLSKDLSRLYEDLSAMTKNNQLKSYFGNNSQFHAVKKNTEGFWDDITLSSQKYMILWMAEGCNVCAHGFGKQIYDSKAVKNSFVILDGINFRCMKDNPELLFMEV